MNVSIFGLGKLGTPMVGVFANKYEVIGLDVNEQNVELLNDATTNVFEPGLNELLKTNQERISATTNYTDAVMNSSISFIIVPTPSDASGKFVIDFVIDVVGKIGKVLKQKTSWHLIVVTSTVLPGDSQDIIAAIENSSGKKCGQGFGYCYNPEFIALGNVIHDLLNPDFTLIGEFDKKSGNVLEEFYAGIISAPISRMSIVNAEIAKIALNSYLTLKITFANELARLCSVIPGAKVDTVSTSIGQDSRIGKKYLRGGTSFSGPCLPRDGRAFNYVAKKYGIELPLTVLVDKLNQSYIDNLLDTVIIHDKKHIGILGLAYKPGTNVTEESPSLILADKLLALGLDVIGYDPLVKQANFPIVCLEDCIRDSDVLVIMLPLDEFRHLGLNDKVVLDCWRVIEHKS